MAAVAHNPGFAKKVGVPQSVGKDFTAADKGRKFSSGGDTSTSEWLKNRKLKKGPNPLDNPKYREEGLEDLSPYFVPGVGGGATKAVGLTSKVGKVSKLSSLVRGAASKVGSAVKSGAERKIVGGISGKVEKGIKHVAKESAKEVGTEHGLDKGVVEPTKHYVEESINTKPFRSVQMKRVKKYAEGDLVTSDEGEGSEQSKKNIANAAVDKSKAEDAKGELNLGKKRGFFGSLLSGHYKDYKRRKELESTFGGMKSAKTMEAEKQSAAVGKGIDFDPSELKTGPDMEAHDKASKMRGARARRRGADSQHRLPNLQANLSGSATDADESSGGTSGNKKESIRENFNSWFKGQKEGSTATWTNPKTGEKKSIFIDRGGSGSKAKTANSTSTSTTKSHRTTGAGSKSYQAPKSKEFDLSGRTKFNGISRSMSGTEKYAAGADKKSTSTSTSSRFLANAEKDKKSAAGDVLKRSPKVTSERELRRQRRESNTQRNYGRATRIKSASNNYCGGGSVKRYAAGGMVSSRADGIASRGRTRCKIV